MIVNVLNNCRRAFQFDGFGSGFSGGRSLENPSIPLTAEFLDDSYATHAGVTVDHATMMGHPPIWRAINLLSGDVSRLTFNVLNRDDRNNKQIDRNNPVQKLLTKNANPYTTANVFKQTLMYHALIYGNGYAWIERDRFTQPKALWVLNPTETEPYFDKETGELYYKVGYSVSGSYHERVIPYLDCLHIRGLSFDGLKGLAQLGVHKESIGLSAAMTKFLSKFFSNGSRMSGLIQMPAGRKLAGEKLNQTRDHFERLHQGTNNSHRVAILQDGATWIQTSMTNEQSELLPSRQFNIIEVSNIYGVPPHKLGDRSPAGYKSLEEENRSYLNEGLDPWLIRWESEADSKMLTTEEYESGSTFTKFNRAELLRTNRKERVDSQQKEVMMGKKSINEIREEDDLPGIGELGDVHYVPVNLGAVEEEPEKDETETENSENESDSDSSEVENSNSKLENSHKYLFSAKGELISLSKWMELQSDVLPKKAAIKTYVKNTGCKYSHDTLYRYYRQAKNLGLFHLN